LYFVLSIPRAYSWMVARSRHKRESGFRPLLTPLSFKMRLTPSFEDTAVIKEYLRPREGGQAQGGPHDSRLVWAERHRTRCRWESRRRLRYEWRRPHHPPAIHLSRLPQARCTPPPPCHLLAPCAWRAYWRGSIATLRPRTERGPVAMLRPWAIIPCTRGTC
jgi:hypothetical protein